MSRALMDLLLFEVDNKQFAIDLNLVEEVVTAGDVTPVPQSPLFFLGLAAVNGRIMGVIHAALRYGFPKGFSNFFMICKVRGNSTAIAIDRPLNASKFEVCDLSEAEKIDLLKKNNINEKFVKNAFELFKEDENGVVSSMNQKILLIEPDIFVSAEMASRIGEV